MLSIRKLIALPYVQLLSLVSSFFNVSIDSNLFCLPCKNGFSLTSNIFNFQWSPAFAVICSTSSEVKTGIMVGVLGVEPRTSSLSGTRSNQLSYTPGYGIPELRAWPNFNWWSLRDSNPWHSACKADTLASWVKAPWLPIVTFNEQLYLETLNSAMNPEKFSRTLTPS